MRDRATWLLAAPAALVLALLFVLPVVAVAVDALTDGGQAFARVFRRPAFWPALAGSATLTVVAAGVSTPIGVAVVCGGRHGVMEAVCRGARAGGGLSIGLLPDADPSFANPYVDVVITTGIGEACNASITRAAFCLVAIGDGSARCPELPSGGNSASWSSASKAPPTSTASFTSTLRRQRLRSSPATRSIAERRPRFPGFACRHYLHTRWQGRHCQNIGN